MSNAPILDFATGKPIRPGYLEFRAALQAERDERMAIAINCYEAIAAERAQRVRQDRHLADAIAAEQEARETDTYHQRNMRSACVEWLQKGQKSIEDKIALIITRVDQLDARLAAFESGGR